MKITVDIELTPEEARQFLGLPNVEALQESMLNRAQDFLKESGQGQMAELVSASMQPMFAYQNWVQSLMQPNASDKSASGKNSGGKNSDDKSS